MRQHKFCPDKQQYNNAKPFPVHVVAIGEVENYYERFKYGAWTWNVPDVLHQNVSFTLFGKFYLKTGMHMNFYFIAAN